MADHGVLQARRPLADPVPLVLHRVLLHAGLEALPQPAVAALVPLVLVHRAVTGKPARICFKTESYTFVKDRLVAELLVSSSL